MLSKGFAAALALLPLISWAGEYSLTVDRVTIDTGDFSKQGIGYNGASPGPILRFREGEDVTIHVTNNLDEPTSVHWHGLILPYQMDGVPGLSYPGIAPGETFTYRFPIKQSGTYWFHSHSGFQEPDGAYGAIVIEPQGREPFRYDREYVVQLTDKHPHSGDRIMRNLKSSADYYNRQQQTVGDFWRDSRERGLAATLKDRLMWGDMRMMSSDIEDVQGFTGLINGKGPEQNWTGLFKPGERVRLRLINSSAMTYFDVRLPGLKMTVVQADGNNVQPVTVDELRIGVAETYDVIVQPKEDQAYTLFAESMGRSGFARGTLAPREGMQGEIPALRPAPLLTMADMGMAHAGMDHGDMAGMDHSGMNHGDMAGMDHSGMNHGEMAGMDHSGMNHGDMAGMDHSGMNHGDMAGMDHSGMNHGDMAGMDHGSMSHGDMAGMDHSGMNHGDMAGMDHSGMNHGDMAGMDHSGMNHGDITGMDHGNMNHGEAAALPADPFYAEGSGLIPQAYNDGRFLSYADLRAQKPLYEDREPTREIELRLTGNMERYIWSINGIKESDAEPIRLQYGERVRFKFVNETMMTHPMHLHGMWSILDVGADQWNPVKHVISVAPGTTVYMETEVDAPGKWAFHCHLSYHAAAGMFRTVIVEGGPEGDDS
ncbi:copper resistance system multicopper oxidase [Halopseudomonas aestusnigri]|jgi:FtsP/CotA-like multicopper oxidase with cupredoxin domain|uniref:copper resistance system multicopper oxidase n=1 Tax=Halopseudomonas aestusnigri TaxID=857252 RepID=UPI000C896D12|nr:copper resistance system multicopper oxidase [Halopseudomonas aestusnigri]MAK75185.1 copper oxidase [Pseudomonadales bacterium]MAP77114.1 copper oxidase [Pseudomonadales bacterium]MAS65695.1 copper oxidase [Pseudomonadales bacterium]UGV30811.1 copper resistance system multicopper oxidase [Halopseudomonas aestusnigri]|tara:strand:- start:3990 stop:5948 length:1959 start_codon:yes stop_codon:yes gene_type:complete